MVVSSTPMTPHPFESYWVFICLEVSRNEYQIRSFGTSSYVLEDFVDQSSGLQEGVRMKTYLDYFLKFLVLVLHEKERPECGGG